MQKKRKPRRVTVELTKAQVKLLLDAAGEANRAWLHPMQVRALEDAEAELANAIGMIT